MDTVFPPRASSRQARHRSTSVVMGVATISFSG